MCTRLGASPLDVALWGLTRNTLRQKERPQLHSEFLAALKEWIDQHNEIPANQDPQNKTHLFQVQKTFTVERVSGGQFNAPVVIFVATEDWDEKDDGKF